MYQFLEKYNFDIYNVDKINCKGVTPLTIAVYENNIYVVNMLLQLNANPFIENTHGNTALMLAVNKRFCKFLIQRASKRYTCNILHCKINQNIIYNNKQYIVTKILSGGACSLAVLEIEDSVTRKKFIAKIKCKFGGLEIRNYIFLDKYIDVILINNLIVYNKSVQKFVAKHVYCLIQKVVCGENLSEAILNCTEEIQQKIIIFSAIKSLCLLHKRGYVHNDALPNNCHFDNNSKQVEFIDYDVMRMRKDILTVEEWQNAQYGDFKRLIMGDTAINNPTKGLMHYFDRIVSVIEEFQDTDIDPMIKHKLITKI